MEKGIVNQEWYQALLIDLKKLEFTGIVLTKHAIGKRIIEDELKFGKPEYGSKRIENLAKDLETTKNNLWVCVQFAKKFDSVKQLQGQSWHYITHELLPEPRQKKEMLPLPRGKYNIIYADPPWKYSTTQHGSSGITDTGGSESHYPILSDEELCKMKEKVEDISAPDCLLFMWATGPKIDSALEIGTFWDFEYITMAFVWYKEKPNPGNYTMSECEYVLVFKRGRIPTPRGAMNIRQFLSEKRVEHSRKPAEIRNRITQMFPKQSKIELFTREFEGMEELKKQNWTFWGDELYEPKGGKGQF